MINKTFAKIILGLCLAIPQFAFAHFHYGLQVETQLHANENQQLSAINMTWVYDFEVSTLMLNDEKDVQKLGNKLLKDLTPFNYFTSLKFNNQIVETGKFSASTIEELKLKEGKKLKISFTLPLKKPISLKNNSTLEIIHEDVSGSAIMYYEGASSISIDPKLNKSCRAEITDKTDFEEGEAPQQTKVVCTA